MRVIQWSPFNLSMAIKRHWETAIHLAIDPRATSKSMGRHMRAAYRLMAILESAAGGFDPIVPRPRRG